MRWVLIRKFGDGLSKQNHENAATHLAEYWNAFLPMSYVRAQEENTMEMDIDPF